MKRTQVLRAVCWATAVVAVVCVARHSSAASATPAPTVEWQAADGSVVRLAETRGKVVLVDFWASWCPPCKESFPALDVIQRDYRARGVDVIAVNLDEHRKDADVFLAAHPHRYLLVTFDTPGTSASAFKVRGMPTSFVIDRQGEIRYTHQGYSATIDATYRRELDLLAAEQAR